MDWIKELTPKLSNFIDAMQQGNYSYFKYSLSGDLFNQEDHWGLANTVYATKILKITGLLDGLSNEQKSNMSILY